MQQTADKKHSEASRKCRRVVERQLEGIGEILRYRCFGLAVTMQQVQACFDWKEGEPVTEEEVWKK